MIELFNGLKYVRTYIEENHIFQLNKVLSKFNQNNFKISAEKSYFARNELEYLGFRITRQGIMPLPDKVEAIKNIVVPSTKKTVKKFYWAI